MRFAAALSTIFVAGFVLASLLDAPINVELTLFAFAAFAATYLLSYGFALILAINKANSSSDKWFGPTHVAAHVIPLGYFTVAGLIEVTLLINLAFFLPFIFFFYTGRRLWKMLFLRFGKKMYVFFVFGNSGMMTAIIATMLLGLLLPTSVGPGPLQGLLFAYFSVHFLLTGPAILQIGSDLRSEAGPSEA